MVATHSMQGTTFPVTILNTAWIMLLCIGIMNPLQQKNQHGSSCAQAFQQNIFLAKPKASIGSSRPSNRSPISMRYQSPWDLDANSGSRKREEGQHLPPGSGSGVASPMPISPASLVQDRPPTVEHPKVVDTSTGFILTFNLPPETEEDGIDVSVSGRLLTIEARVPIHEQMAEHPGVGGTRTHSAARSFVLPIGVSHEVTASWVSAGKVEVQLSRTHLSAENAITATSVFLPQDGGGIAMVEDAGVVLIEGFHFSKRRHQRAEIFAFSSISKDPSGTDTRQGSRGRDSDDKSVASRVGDDSTVNHVSSSDSSAATEVTTERDSTVSAGVAPHQGQGEQDLRQKRQQPCSRLAVLDEEFRNAAKTMRLDRECGRVVKFPTEDEVAATVERAKAEKAKRVRAIRRATMATDVSEMEDLSSYMVRIALPEGCKRDDVKLTVTPENALSVSFRSEDRALSKDVRLPCDAVLSAISARFKPEEANHAGHVTLEGYVSDLEVVVGRATSPEPKVIEIS